MIQLFKRIIESDILDELLKHKSKYDLDENIYTQFCKNRIDVYMKQIKLKNISTNCNKKYTSRNIFKYKKNRCKARIWSNGYGGQCSCKNTYNGFCKTHFMKGGDKWWLGTIDKQKPINPINRAGKVHIWL